MNITTGGDGDETNCWISTQSKNSIRDGFPRIARDRHYNIRKIIKKKCTLYYYSKIIL